MRPSRQGVTADLDPVHEVHSVNSNARIAAVAAAIVAPPVPLQVAESHRDFPNTTRSRQGLTLVHISAKRERFLWDRGCN